MQNSKQIEELAKLDGFDAFIHPTGSGVWYHTEGSVYKLVPPYLRSHDALQPIIDGMGDSIHLSYHHELGAIAVTRDRCRIHQATPEQKAEAILRAYGKWEEEE